MTSKNFFLVLAIVAIIVNLVDSKPGFKDAGEAFKKAATGKKSAEKIWKVWINNVEIDNQQEIANHFCTHFKEQAFKFKEISKIETFQI